MNEHTNPEEIESTSINDEAVETEMGADQIDFSPVAEPTLDTSEIDLGKVAELEQKLADAEHRTLLAIADLDNFRRRSRRDMQDQLRYAPLPLMAEILDAIDNLERAIDSHQTNPESQGLVDGMKMVVQQLSNTLANHGCTKIEAVGQPFDPNLHQAVQLQESTDYPPNTVILDLRPGYLLYDRVVRPSQVFVSANPT